MSWGEGIASRFKPGDKVHVAARYPEKGHFRTPFYCRGKIGVVERICGQFHNPEELAFGKYDGPTKVLYRVRFDQKQVWPGYRGNPADKVEIEIFEHWLDPAK
jgi:nitrile hydratase